MREIDFAADYNDPITSAADEHLLSAIGWAVMHRPTQEAYRRCTGEDAAPVLDCYVAWLQENIIGEGYDAAADFSA